MSKIIISTIIVSYNTADLTLQAIRSVFENHEQDNINGEVIVVDNNSSDDSVKLIRQEFKNSVLIIENKDNPGFAKANNQAIKISQGTYIFLLNSDTILQPHAINKLLSTFDNYPEDYNTEQLAKTPKQVDRLGIVSGQLLNKDGSIQPQGGALPTLLNLAIWWLWPLPGEFPLFPAHSRYHIEQVAFFEKENVTGWVGGTAMLMKREVIEEIGDLDESIFMYAEDVDFCWRARNHHWDVLLTPAAKIVHYGSASSSSTRALIGEIKGLQYILAKHLPSWQFQFSLVILYFGAWLRWLLFGIILNNAEKKQAYSEIIQSLRQE